MGCHFLLQEIFQTQGSNPSLLHLLRPLGSPHRITGCIREESSPWRLGYTKRYMSAALMTVAAVVQWSSLLPVTL